MPSNTRPWAWTPTPSRPSEYLSLPTSFFSANIAQISRRIVPWRNEARLQQQDANCTLITRRPANHPKPNTRFLNNIVKATNNHNQNLLEQERADSRARLKDLDRTKRAADEREQRRRPGAADTRNRMLGDIKAILGGSSRKRKTEDNDREADLVSESKRSRKDEGEIKIRGRRHASTRDSDRDDSKDSNIRNAKKELFADHGPKRGLPREERRDERRESRERRHRHDRHTSSTSRTSRADRTSRNHDSGEPRKERRSHDHDSKGRFGESDSDPLEDIIGPKPPSPVRKRGRGTTSGSSAMDSRFASNYDPKADVSLNQDEEDDDWGSALEALRDRERWKQQGADRLRAAGFTDDQVKKWEKGDQKNEEDVKWSKKGDEREWDRGKVLKGDF